MNSHREEVAPVATFLVNLLYVMGMLAGSLAAAYGLFIFFVTVIINSRFDISDFHISSFAWFGVILGLPLILAGFAYLAFVSNMLFRAKFRRTKYRPIVWLSALLGLVGLCLLSYFVFLSTRGL